MNCKMDPDLIQRYLEGTLNLLENVIVEGHIEACENCKRELEELSSLFRALDGLEESAVDLPVEALVIRERVLNDYVDATRQKSFSIREFVDIQKQAFQKAGKFMDFMPGLKAGAAYVEKGLNKTPHLLYKAIGGAYTGGRKLMMTRVRA